MDLTEKQLSEEKVFEGRLLDVRKYTVELPNKDISTREVIVHPGAVAVLPIDDEGNVYLVKQHRFPIRSDLVEIPAGKFDEPGEDPLECGKRELEEEIGKLADEWIYMGYIYTTPGFSNEIIHLYTARKLHEGVVCTDDDEFIDIMKVNSSEFEKMIESCEITDAKTITAFARAKLKNLI